MDAEEYPTNQQLIAALRTLFGPEASLSRRFFARLTPSILKTVYRRKALATHPDRAVIIPRPADELNTHFKQVSAAYHTISEAMAHQKPADEADSRNSRIGTDASQRARRNTHRRQNLYYRGPLPRRPLLIGQFLYYSGLISWQDLIDALVWQRIQRPRIGQIALGWKILSRADIRRILASRRPGEKFAECGRRQGLINTFQHMALIGRQRNLQQPLGGYFIRRGRFSSQDVNDLVERMKKHNRTHRV